MLKLMKWVAESSPAAVTRRSGKMVTLQLSGGCHPMERSLMEVGRVRWRLVSQRIVLFPTTACSSINRR
ncbi:unnamed protein product [Spirodela intermedia]|uniref:Uncharacterized protein n=1 Tax=Spirodela intermedia TaxID=51605 RepID=A0A7I8KA13_SPIIN|nr:unnamed protein product [Spirodela intermedia]CAA7394551.1 unnamed protein product [Spirodela intermedia]